MLSIHVIFLPKLTEADDGEIFFVGNTHANCDNALCVEDLYDVAMGTDRYLIFF